MKDLKKIASVGLFVILQLFILIVIPSSTAFASETKKTNANITMDLDDYRSDDIYDYDFDDLYGDLYGSLEEDTNSGYSAYSNPSSYGMGGFNLDDLSGLNLPSLYDLMDELLEMFDSPITKLYYFLSFLFAILWCFCGYRVFHVFTGITSFIIINLAGIALAFFDDGGAIVFLLGLILSIVFLILCIKFKSFAAFLLGSVNSIPFFALIFLLVCKDVNTTFYVLTALFSIALGIITAVFKKPVIIIITALEWGLSAGVSFGCLIHHTRFGSGLGILFVIAGLLYQCYYHGGLLESGPLFIKSFRKEGAGAGSGTATASASLKESFKRKATAHETATASRSASSDVKAAAIPSKKAEPETTFCSRCGAKQLKTSVFCTACGASMNADGAKGKTSEVAETKTELTEKPDPSASSVKEPVKEPMGAASTYEEPASPSPKEEKLKFSSFTRVAEAPPAPAKRGELKINLAEGKPEPHTRLDPNSKMKPADDFDD